MDEPFYLEIFRKGRNRNMAIVVPELFSDATNAAMDHHIRIGKVAFDATELVGTRFTSLQLIELLQVQL